MPKPGDQDVGFAISDRAPNGEAVTDYDRDLTPIYLRLLDAAEADAPWEDVTRRLLDVDPQKDRDRARLRYETHLARARWMSSQGYAQLTGAPSTPTRH